MLEGDFDLTKTLPGDNPADGQGPDGATVWRRRRGGERRSVRRQARCSFPDEHVSERAALGLRFSFLQVHTGALRWRLAAVPLAEAGGGRQAAARVQLEPKLNPFSGAPETDDSDVADPVMQPTELLVDAFHAGDAARRARSRRAPARRNRCANCAGHRPAARACLPARTCWRWTVPCWNGKGTVGQPLARVLLPRASSPRRRTPDTVLARVAGMADGLPRPGITVRASEREQFRGGARHDRPRWAWSHFRLRRPGSARGARTGASRRAASSPTRRRDRPSATLDGPGLGERRESRSRTRPADPRPKARSVCVRVVLTDRSLYRPGQTVRIKGLARTVKADGSEHGTLCTFPPVRPCPLDRHPLPSSEEAGRRGGCDRGRRGWLGSTEWTISNGRETR